MSTVTPTTPDQGGLAPDPAVVATKGSGAKKLPIIFGVILEECTPEERRAMLAKLPLPVRLVLRTVGAWQCRRYVTRVRGR